MLDIMSKKVRLPQAKAPIQGQSVSPEQISLDLVLVGLILVLFLGFLTWWHFTTHYLTPAASVSPQPTTVPTPTLSAQLFTQADLNHDGHLDNQDGEILKAAFYKTDAAALQADLNSDNKVDAADYSLFVELAKSSNQEQK